ncbi:hypothetical protein QDY71_07875 [Kingella negevensis]|nr:hypothetical protein [Kingella negevensis]MDK4680728.1 hypothetical protein [Kingella negevensis]MDK4681549.1 hypothetical protein [Kingella negevensis]MDK4683631.1 hypothetical protein [Kingella negevensis]MDK4691936.1 hypothetical protein [Kingella negevensis]MDK4692911.1 hypothetical protein [Kingella negevensis]
MNKDKCFTNAGLLGEQDICKVVSEKQMQRILALRDVASASKSHFVG